MNRLMCGAALAALVFAAGCNDTTTTRPTPIAFNPAGPAVVPQPINIAQLVIGTIGQTTPTCNPAGSSPALAGACAAFTLNLPSSGVLVTSLSSNNPAQPLVLYVITMNGQVHSVSGTTSPITFSVAVTGGSIVQLVVQRPFEAQSDTAASTFTLTTNLR